MESIQDKVTRKDRHVEIMEVLEKGSMNDPTQYNMKPLFDFIANVAEQAYLAGYNKLNLSEKQDEEVRIHQHGDVLTLARNFVKDKGLRI